MKAISAVLLVVLATFAFTGCDPLLEQKQTDVSAAQRELEQQIADFADTGTAVGNSSANAEIYGQGVVKYESDDLANVTLSLLVTLAKEKIVHRDLAARLISIGQHTQTNPIINSTNIRFRALNLGYQLILVKCLSDADSAEALERCKMMNGLAMIFEGFSILDLSVFRTTSMQDQADQMFRSYADSALKVYSAALAIYGADQMPQPYANLKIVTDDTIKTLNTRTNLNGALGTIAKQQIAIGLDVSYGCQSFVSAGAYDELENKLLITQAALGSIDVVTHSFYTNREGVDLDNQAMGYVIGDVTASVDSNTPQTLLDAISYMEEMQMSFGQQYLNLQASMEHEEDVYREIARILAAKHDTVKNSVANVR